MNIQDYVTYCYDCRKNSYGSLNSAGKNKNMAQKRSRIHLRVYECPVTQGRYHLTSKPLYANQEAKK